MWGAAGGLPFCMSGHAMWLNASGAFVGAMQNNTLHSTTDRVTHIQLSYESGNIASGTFVLSGLF
jgi:hypothetical protein